MHCATDSLPQSVRSLHVDCLHNANPELKREVLLFASLGLLRFETGISNLERDGHFLAFILWKATRSDEASGTLGKDRRADGNRNKS